MEIVDARDFSRDALDPELRSYVVRAATLDTNMHPDRQARLGAIEDENLREVVIPVDFVDFTDVFSDEKADKLPPDSTDDHCIPTDTGKQPPFGSIYSLSQAKLEFMRAYIEKTLASGFIRPSTSPAGAPIPFTKKNTGGLCLCVYYRGLNKITIKNRYPLPLIGETLDRLGRCEATHAAEPDQCLPQAPHQGKRRMEDSFSNSIRPLRVPVMPTFNSMVGESCKELLHLEAAFVLDKPTELDDEEVYVMLNLLRYILNYDPAKRPSAMEILDHPWFEDAVS